MTGAGFSPEELDIIDRVQRITIDRQDKRNALSRVMRGAMAHALEDAEASSEIRVHYITAAGAVLTAGNDLADFMDPSAGFADVRRFLVALRSLKKPLVIAVSGPAVGIGVTMLLHADLIYAAESATFKTPFVDLGLVPEAGSSLLMPARMGYARANGDAPSWGVHQRRARRGGLPGQHRLPRRSASERSTRQGPTPHRPGPGGDACQQGLDAPCQRGSPEGDDGDLGHCSGQCPEQ
ncbi:MAG: enoyl-CoA hydratase/carnithine racemase [Myxococcota bacterium]